MPDFVLNLLRLLIGLLGAWWLLAGLWGAVDAATDGAYGPAVGGLLFALAGFGLAYGSFVRAP